MTKSSWFGSFLLSLAVSTVAIAQPVLTCVASAVPQVIAAEGVTERVGDIVLNCSGGNPNAQITGNLTVFLSVDITNRISTSNAADVFLTADNGSGPQPANVPGIVTGAATLVFNGLNFTLSPTGTATLRLANLRAAANQLNLVPASTISAFVSMNSGNQVAITNSQFIVATTQRGLYASQSDKITCSQAGSPAPGDTTSLMNFIAAGSVFNSTRVTEGFADAFNPRGATKSLDADTGTRIIVQYSGFPAHANLYVPNVVAGSDAVQPTAAGDFGPAPSGGVYAPTTTGSLLLARVLNTDANGAGGMVVFTPGAPGSGQVQLGAMGQVPLTNGSGFVVYEVVDANPNVVESAQFPTFLTLPANTGETATTSENLSLAPVSTVFTASTTAPIPRFINAAPLEDCTIIGDCGANYFPVLHLNVSTPLNYSIPEGGNYQVLYVQVNNNGGGVMEWNAIVNYSTGSGWLRLTNSSGVNSGTIRIDALPGTLAPGTYNATLTVDAGTIAGTQTVPVTLTITAAGPAIQSVVNSATFQAAPVSPGSIASVMGTALSGKNVTVTFDGVPGQVLYDGATQINVVLPAGLGSRTTTQMVVTVDGNISQSTAVPLAPFSPGIFQNGVLNQDYSVNGPNQAAPRGSIIQIFATGLSGNGTLSATINGVAISQPYYAGPAPSLPGVQQVDLVIPDDLTGSTAQVAVCAAATATNVVCSPAVSVALQ